MQLNDFKNTINIFYTVVQERNKGNQKCNIYLNLFLSMYLEHVAKS